MQQHTKGTLLNTLSLFKIPCIALQISHSATPRLNHASLLSLSHLSGRPLAQLHRPHLLSYLRTLPHCALGIFNAFNFCCAVKQSKRLG